MRQMLHTTTAGGRRARRGLRSARTGLTGLVTALALVASLAAPAHAADDFDYRRKLTTPGADLNLKTYALQNQSSPSSCYVYVRQSFEVINGSGHSQPEAEIELAAARALTNVRVDLSNGVNGNYKPRLSVINQASNPYGYLSISLPSSNGFCPDAIQNDYHRRLGVIGTLGKTVGAIMAGTVVTVLFTAGVTVLAADFFPGVYANPNFIPGVACVAGALGIFTTQSILGTDGATKAASAAAACVGGAFGDKLQTLAKWFGEKRPLSSMLNAADPDGLELISDFQSSQMQAFLTSFGD